MCQNVSDAQFPQENKKLNNFHKPLVTHKMLFKKQHQTILHNQHNYPSQTDGSLRCQKSDNIHMVSFILKYNCSRYQKKFGNIHYDKKRVEHIFLTASTKGIFKDAHLQIKAVPNSSGSNSLLGKVGRESAAFFCLFSKTYFARCQFPQTKSAFLLFEYLNKSPKFLLNSGFETTQVHMDSDGSHVRT